MNLARIAALAGYPMGYLAGLAGLVLFWGAENFFIQAFLFDGPPITRYPRSYQCNRLGINLTVAAMFVLAFSQPALMVLAGANFLLSVTVLAHGIYFRRACSLVYGIRNFREGLQTWSFALRLIPGTAWVGLLCALIIKLCWIWQLTAVPPPFQPSGLGIGLLLALLVAQLGVLQFTSFRFTSIRLTSITRAVYAYGYLNSWLAEFVFAPDARQRIQEIADLRQVSPDRLADRENPWPVNGHVAVIQLESVCGNVLDCRIRGQEVTPYLNRLARTGRVFELQAYHNIGTADMDYAALSGGTPSRNLISYFVPEIDYSSALPRFLRQHGFRTVALHGATGEFYNRRRNFERMGFDEILFREQFQGRRARHSYWGVRDRELFRLSAEKLRTARSPEFHFLITLDSHGPFDLITEEEKKLFPGSRAWQENYFNSLRVLDDNLRDYVESLPAGTLVVLYGDHTAGVSYGDFHSAREGDAEYVPCLVHVCGISGNWGGDRGLQAPLPRVLRVLDVLNFLRRQVRARDGAARQMAAAAECGNIPVLADPEQETGEFVAAVFRAWQEAGISFLVLRNYEQLPNFTTNDIDVLVELGQLRRAEETLLLAARETGFRLHNRAEFGPLALYFSSRRSTTQVHFDLMAAMKWRGFDFISCRDFFDRRVDRGLFAVPHPGHEAATSLLSFLIYTGKVKNKYKPAIAAGFRSEPVVAADLLALTYGKAEARFLAAAAAEERWTDIEGRVGALRHALVLRQSVRHPWATLASLLHDAARLGKRFIQPPGLTVVLCGVDGSGKSTAARAVLQGLGCTFSEPKGRHFYWKPALFAARRRAKRTAAAGPRDESPRNFFGGLCYFGFHWLEFFLGPILLIRPVTFRNGLVLIERSYFDLLVDPRRYRLRVPRWLVRLGYRLLKKSDLVVLLDAPAAVLCSRKPELVPAEVQRLRQSYRDFVQSLGHGRIIDATQPPEKVAADIQMAVLEFMAEREGKTCRSHILRQEEQQYQFEPQAVRESPASESAPVGVGKEQ